MKPEHQFAIGVITVAAFVIAATTKPAEVRAKDPLPAKFSTPNAIERLIMDGHLYYWIRSVEHQNGGSSGSLAVSNPLLIHAAGCTNHAPCPVSVQAEVGVIRAEDVMPAQSETNLLDMIKIWERERKTIQPAPYITPSAVLGIHFPHICEHEPGLANNWGVICGKCGKPIKAVYK